MSADVAEATESRAAGWALLALVVFATGARLVWAAAMVPGHDETYHALFASRLDWIYIDHPPMTALVARVGLSVGAGWLPRLLAVRLGFVALGAGSTVLMARLAGRLFGPWAGFLAAFLLNATAYYGAAVGAFALPDGPLLFFWLLTLVGLAKAVERPERLGLWVGVGLAWTGALLSKYHAVFLPVGALVFLASGSRERRVLRRPGPYLAAAVGMLGFAPVVVWNAAHGWSSFLFQGQRALGSGRFRPESLLASVGGQALYILPWIWLPLILSLSRSLGRWRRGEAKASERFLLAQALPPLAVFFGLSCFRSMLPHWSLIGLLPGLPLLGADWSSRWAAEPVRMRRRLTTMTVVPIVLAALVLAHMRFGLLPSGSARPGRPSERLDPTGEFVGWGQLAAAIHARRLDRFRDTFLFTGRWYTSGQLAFALEEVEPGGAMPEVLCFNRSHAQNFAYWSQPGDWKGRDAVYVGFNDNQAELADFRRYFEAVEPLGDVPICRRAQVLRIAHLYLCRRLITPFPFGNAAKPPRPPGSPSRALRDKLIELAVDEPGGPRSPWPPKTN